MMNSDKVLREQLLALLRGGNAHLGFENAIAEFPPAHINTRPPNVPYTPWHLLEHIRIAQWDILEFIRNPDHVSPKWPQGYWPPQDAKADEVDWEKTIRDFRAGLQTLQDIVRDPATDFFAPIPHAKSYTIFREILLVADHNAFHIGEFSILRQVMETWPANRQ
ncbi:MAG: DinB family protein [Anaerolineae bacterium]